VISAAMLIFVPTIGDYVTPTLVGGGKPESTMIANIIQSQIKANNWPLAAAAAFVSMAMVAATVVIAAWALRLAARSIR
jgi:spermidine/putrescine transport system permease protein